jgi:hypothetical protein
VPGQHNDVRRELASASVPAMFKAVLPTLPELPEPELKAALSLLASACASFPGASKAWARGVRDSILPLFLQNQESSLLQVLGHCT